MRSINVIFIPLAVWVCSVAAEDKIGKHFSLFSVVTFGNEECTSSSSVAGGATEGTCYSSTECSDKNGMAAGNCASGFGVCCVFLNTGAATATISENRTRLRNSEYPSIATATTAQTIVYTVNKMNADICQIRLDFTNFVVAGPAVTTELIPTGASTVCQDSLVIATSDNSALTSSPTGTLCGTLTGEHLYVDLSPTSSDTLTATLTTLVSGALTPAIAKRTWDVKVSQIECHALYRAPPGCQRYMMEDYGKIISYNFRMEATSATRAANAQNPGVELAMQNVKTCIRRAKHMCCVQYQLCSSYNGIALGEGVTTNAVANMGVSGYFSQAWLIDTDTTPFIIDADLAGAGMVDSQCTTDYVEIPSSMSRQCGSMFGSHLGSMNTRFCGSKFGASGIASVLSATIGTSGTPVCDCSEPWTVTHKTDDRNDEGNTNTANVGGSAATIPRGFCLDYQQTPCYS